MMTYNPPYYARLIENYGFRKTQDLYAFWGHVDMLPQIGRSSGPWPSRSSSVTTSAPSARQVAVPGGRGDVSVGLQPLAGEHVGFRADVADECATWPAAALLIVPELAIAAEIDGRMVGALRPARLQPAHQGDQRPVVPVRLHPFAAEPAGDQAGPADQHQCAARVPTHGRGPGADAGLAPKAMEWGLQEAEFSWVLDQLAFLGSLKKGGPDYEDLPAL